MTRSTEPHRAQPSGARKFTVAAVDSVPMYRDGLSGLVHRTYGLRWIGYASSHHMALQLSEQLRPNVMLLDSGMDPHCHLVKLLTADDPGLLVVILIRDAHRDSRYLGHVIAAGAAAAVPRSGEPRQIAEAIQRCSLDRRYLDPSLAILTARPKRQPPRPRSEGEEGSLSTDPSSLAAPVPRMPLSRREYQVLQLIAEGLENSAIAKVLYLSVETVRTHVKSILRKLSARDRTHAVTTAFRTGILIIQPDDQLIPSKAPVSKAVSSSHIA